MKILSISEEKRIYTKKEEVEELVKRIEEIKETLKEIDLTENSFSAEALAEVLKALAQAKQLEVVILRGIFTQRGKTEVEQSLRHIAEYVGELEEVQFFDISDNALSLYGMEILSPMIGKMKNLRHLVINNNGIGRGGGEHLASCLKSLSKINNKLESLEVGRNRLEDTAKLVAESLKEFTYLDSVKMYQNSIGALVIGEVLDALYPMNIRVLDLGDNFLLEHGAIALARCMEKWNIEVLDVSDCLIGDKGFQALNTRIGHKIRIPGELAGLRTINLTYNEITSESLESVKSFIEKFPSSEIHLSGNEFEKKEVEEITAAAEQSGVEVVYEEEESLVFSSEAEGKEEEKEEEEKEEKDLSALEEKISELSVKKTEKNEIA